MSYLEELLPEFRNGAKIRRKNWVDDDYIQLRKKGVFDGHGNIISKDDFTCRDWFFKDDWELYKVPEPDWDSIIKNKRLCWFWDGDENRKCMGILKEVGNFIPNYKFINHNKVRFKNCRPVRRDEVTFYEDKEDVNKDK